MSVIHWIKRRTKSRYAVDKAVGDFERSAWEQNAPRDYDQHKYLAELLSSDNDPADSLDEIAKLLGQWKKTPSCSGWTRDRPAAILPPSERETLALKRICWPASHGRSAHARLSRPRSTLPDVERCPERRLPVS